jgi:hypothetical protein
MDLSKTVPVREELDRCRTVSAGSSREGHGRNAVTRNPETPGGGALERLTPRASPHAPSLPTQFAAGSIPTQSKTWASSSPTSSTRPTHLVSPAIDSPLSASPSGSSFPTRRPSLASPLPPTPIVPPAPFPKATFHHAAPAPFSHPHRCLRQRKSEISTITQLHPVLLRHHKLPHLSTRKIR